MNLPAPVNQTKETLTSVNILFPEKVLVSCVTKTQGPLTKIMRIDPDTGAVVKDGSECSMWSGTIKTIPVSSPEGFARLLRSRESNQALVHGICEYDSATITTTRKVKSCPSTEDNPVIARSKDFIKYPDAPGVMMFDHDKPRPLSTGSDEALLSYAPIELLEKLSAIHPAIAGAAYVSSPSTSSCIYSATGEQLRGEGSGSHVYLFVKKASDIPRYLETIGKRLLLAGLGKIELSRPGAALPRTIIDLSVGSDERLDFVAGAVCQDGLVQRLPYPVIRNGELLDTESLASLTLEEEETYQSILQDLIRQAKPNQEKVKAEYVDTEAGKLVAAKNIPLEEARKIVTSRQDHVLEDDDVLYFSHLKDGVTVSHVLENGSAFHGKPLADPLEPEYENFSKTKAKFYWNDGDPVINSFAHGQVKYTFRRFGEPSVDYSEDDIVAFLDRVKDDCGAPFEPDVIKMLATLKRADKSRFMQVRDEIKRSNSSVIITEVDKDIRFFLKKTSFRYSSPSSSSLSSSYHSFKSTLNKKVLHFKDALITTDENEKEGIVVESLAAELVSSEIAGQFAFDPKGMQWLMFEKNRWKPCDRLELDTWVIDLLYAGAGHIGFKNSFGIAVSALLQKNGQNRLPIVPEGKIPFSNGLLDMTTMVLEPITHENANTWVLPFNYEREAKCPNFLQWLHVCVDGDQDTIRLIRAWINALITGRPDLQVFLHLIGPGGTGKSTLGRVLFVIVGDANATTTSLKQLETNRFEAANIFGKRLVAIEEADKYGGSVSVLKSMTGQDPLRLERKNVQQQGSFIYDGQTLMISNELLATTDYTSGLERRRVTVEFARRITKEERADFENRGGEAVLLYRECPGIVNWALGLSKDEVSSIFKEMPNRIRKANLEAARFNNPVVDWMLQNLIPDEQAQTQIGCKEEYRGNNGELLYRKHEQRLYPNYLTWCLSSGREKVSLQRFSKSIIDAANTYGIDIKKDRTGGGTMLYGLRIRSEYEKSWLDNVENVDLMKTSMKDNSLKMHNMKEMKDFSNHSPIEKRGMPPCPAEAENAEYF